jgi:hypothetical protein
MRESEETAVKFPTEPHSVDAAAFTQQTAKLASVGITSLKFQLLSSCHFS